MYPEEEEEATTDSFLWVKVGTHSRIGPFIASTGITFSFGSKDAALTYEVATGAVSVEGLITGTGESSVLVTLNNGGATTDIGPFRDASGISFTIESVRRCLTIEVEAATRGIVVMND